MSWRILVVSAVVACWGVSALAEGDAGGGQGGGQAQAVVATDDGHGNQQVRVFTGGGPGGGMAAGPGGFGYAMWQPSLVDKLSGFGGSWVYGGAIPPKYEVLNLTDEQKTAIQKVATDARDGIQKLNKETMEAFRQNRDPNTWREQQKKMEELTKTCETRMMDILTDEQRALLKKLDDLAAKKKLIDDKIREVMDLAFAKNRENCEAELAKILTPEQLKKLEEAGMSPMMRRGGGPGGGGAQPAPAKPAEGTDAF